MIEKEFFKKLRNKGFLCSEPICVTHYKADEAEEDIYFKSTKLVYYWNTFIATTKITYFLHRPNTIHEDIFDIEAEDFVGYHSERATGIFRCILEDN